MTSKPDKEKKSTGKTNNPSRKDADKKISPKSKKQEEDDDALEEEEEVETTPSSKKGGKAASASKKSKSNDDDGDEDPIDEWDKVEEDEEWDPDFEEFDLPKSKVKKSSGGKKGAEEEEEFKIDDEFKDLGLFNEGDFEEEDEDF